MSNIVLPFYELPSELKISSWLLLSSLTIWIVGWFSLSLLFNLKREFWEDFPGTGWRLDWSVPENDEAEFVFLILEREVGPQQSYQRGRDTNLPRLYCVESGGPAGETHLTVFPSPVPRSSLNLGCSTNRIIVAVRTSASFDNLGITRNNSLTLSTLRLWWKYFPPASLQLKKGTDLGSWIMWTSSSTTWPASVSWTSSTISWRARSLSPGPAAVTVKLRQTRQRTVPGGQEKDKSVWSVWSVSDYQSSQLSWCECLLLTDSTILSVLFISCSSSCWPGPAPHGPIKHSVLGRGKYWEDRNKQSTSLLSSGDLTQQIFFSSGILSRVLRAVKIQSANTRSCPGGILSIQVGPRWSHCIALPISRHTAPEKMAERQLTITTRLPVTISHCLTLFRHVMEWSRSHIQNFSFMFIGMTETFIGFYL